MATVHGVGPSEVVEEYAEAEGSMQMMYSGPRIRSCEGGLSQVSSWMAGAPDATTMGPSSSSPSRSACLRLCFLGFFSPLN